MENDSIQNQQYAKARIMVRKKLSERLGGDYESLTPDKQRIINEAMASKQMLIRQLALKLSKKSTVSNLGSKTVSSFVSGNQLKNYGSPERGEGSGNNVDRMFTERFSNPGPIPPADAKVTLYPSQKPKGTVKLLRKFSEEFVEQSPIFRAISKKAEQHDISLDILSEVYDRGISDWDPTERQTQQQYAFARVNSFINRGKTYFTEDRDLQIDEARAPSKPQVRPFFDDEGKQIGWKSSNKWGKVRWWRLEAKESAKKHAGIADEVKESTSHFAPINESFNIAFSAGVGVTLTAKDLGMHTQGGFQHHPSVIDELERRQAEAEAEEVYETAFSSDRKPVVVPAYVRYTPKKDGSIEPVTIRTRTVMRRTKKPIIKSGNVYDGKKEDTE